MTTLLELSAVENVNAAVPAYYTNGFVSYPSTIQEIYTFYEGSTLLRTITINYVDASKEKIDSWVIG